MTVNPLLGGQVALITGASSGIGAPAARAMAAVWLACDESDHVVGTRLFVGGGMSLYPGFQYGG